VLRLAQQNTAIVPFEQTLKPYGDWLRAMVYNAVHSELSQDDWWLILDSDEFLAEDPRPVIETAVGERANIVNTWQIQFYFTERDLEAHEQGEDSRDIPIFNRRRYYLINWQENRLFLNQPHRSWNTAISIKTPDGPIQVCSRRILNRHYQFRDPDQIKKRLHLRYGNPLFPHVPSPDWRSVIRDSRKLNFYREGDPWRFSASGILYYYRRSLSREARLKYQWGLRQLQGLLTPRSIWGPR
jgi:hypothetical protein